MLTPDVLRKIAEREMVRDGERLVVKVSPRERDLLVDAARMGACGVLTADDAAVVGYLGRGGHGRA